MVADVVDHRGVVVLEWAVEGHVGNHSWPNFKVNKVIGDDKFDHRDLSMACSAISLHSVFLHVIILEARELAVQGPGS